jgi:uncharacterized cupin superfamily protein
MIIHDLSARAVERMMRVDLARAKEEPPSQIGTFEFHGCTCGVTSFSGRPPWELHTGDELLHILAGETDLTLLEGQGATSRHMQAGDLVVIPQDCWHRNEAPNGVTMLWITPAKGSRHSWKDPRGSEHS